nr:(2Fe-2S) ferredoxin domain-containing protein [Archangium primigenium]
MAAARPVRPPWKSGFVLVCKKCSGNDKIDLRKWLEHKLRAEGHEDDVHILKMSCMDICPKARVMAVIPPGQGGSTGGCYAVDPVSEREDFYQQILKILPDTLPDTH